GEFSNTFQRTFLVQNRATCFELLEILQLQQIRILAFLPESCPISSSRSGRGARLPLRESPNILLHPRCTCDRTFSNHQYYSYLSLGAPFRRRTSPRLLLQMNR